MLTRASQRPVDMPRLWSGRSLVTTHLVVADVGPLYWIGASTALSLVGRNASQGCSTDNWPVVPPRRVARQRRGWSLRLAGLGRDLVGHSAS